MARRARGEPGLRRTRVRGAVAIALLCGSFVAGRAAWAAFTGTATPTHSVATGTVNLAIPGVGSTNRLNVNISGTSMYPGSSSYRAFAITNTGSLALKTVTVAATLPGGSVFDAGSAGLQWTIERCTVSGTPTAWTENAASAPDYTYTCPGGTVDGTSPSTTLKNFNGVQDISLYAPLAVGAVNYYRATITLASSAGATTMGVSAAVTFTFDATQRDAASK